MSIVTTSSGLVAGAVEIDGQDHVISAYRAAPEAAVGSARLPVVLVMHQIYGINDYTRDVCRRLARAGYVALLPDLYARYGSVAGMTREQIAEGIAKAVEDDAVLQDIEACAAWAVRQAGGDEDRIGIAGFAWGAQFVWRACASPIRLRAGVSWYGRLVRTESPARPRSWREVAGTLRAPVLGLYAGIDPYISAETFDEMKQALSLAPVPTDLVYYPEARHGFHADYQPQYREAEAQDGWARQMAWFVRFGLR